MNFNSKETYLAARKEWTTNYNELSNTVRKTRKEYREAQQGYAKTYMPWPIYRKSTDEQKNASYKNLVILQNALCAYEDAKQEARDMIEELHEAKKEAAEQWLASRRPA